jgi:hypothetical protein
MDQACEFDMGDVSRGAVNTFEVPDGFGTLGDEISQMISAKLREGNVVNAKLRKWLGSAKRVYVRAGVYFIQETTAIAPVEDPWISL